MHLWMEPELVQYLSSVGCCLNPSIFCFVILKSMVTIFNRDYFPTQTIWDVLVKLQTVLKDNYGMFLLDMLMYIFS